MSISTEIKRMTDEITAMSDEDRASIWGVEVKSDGTVLEIDTNKKFNSVADFVRVSLAEEINTADL